MLRKSVYKEQNLVNMIIISLYLLMTNFWGLVDEKYLNVKGIGKLYDLLFIVVLIIAAMKISYNKETTVKKKTLYILIPYIILTLYIVVEGVRAMMLGETMLQVIRTIREFLFFYIIIFFLNYKFNYKQCIKIIINLEVIGSILYIIQFIVQKPIMKGYYIYENLGGGTVLRHYARTPLIGLFTITVLLIAILSNEYYESKIKDSISLFVIIVAMTLSLTRGLWIMMIVSIIYSIIISGNKAIELKRIISFIAIIIIILFFIPKFMPSITERFHSAFEDLEEGNGTIGYRQEIFESRYNYLEQKDKVLIGLGALNSDYNINFNTKHQSGILTNDIGYATILIRYGIIGIILYLISLMQLIYIFRTKSNEAKAFSFYIFAHIILTIQGNYILDYNIMNIGILSGIIIKSIDERRTL